MFWRKKAAPPEEPAGPKLAEASQRMGATIASLEERVRACDADLAKYKAGQISKSSAVAALKRRKMLEQQLNQLSGTHAAVEQIQFAVEAAETQQLAVKAMRQTMDAASLLPKLGDVESLAEEMEEFLDEQREMGEMLRPQGLDVTDADLEAEFAELEAQVQALPAPAPTVLGEREAHSI